MTRWISPLASSALRASQALHPLGSVPSARQASPHRPSGVKTLSRVRSSFVSVAIVVTASPANAGIVGGVLRVAVAWGLVARDGRTSGHTSGRPRGCRRLVGLEHPGKGGTLGCPYPVFTRAPQLGAFELS